MSLTGVPIVESSKPTEVIMTRLELSKARAELWVNISRCYQASGKTLNEYFKLCWSLQQVPFISLYYKMGLRAACLI